VLSLFAPPVHAKVFYSRQEAIALAFPEADRVDKKTTILTADQLAAIEEAGRVKVESKLVTIFTAYRGDEVLGYAHIDIQTVRTHAAALMVVINPEGDVRSVRILAFHEPLDYLPSEKWYAQFAGKTLEDRLRIGGDVHGVVSATLSTRAATDSIRRALAYHAVLIGSGD
jgi:transcriptional regulator of nitric oxide reductase